MKYLLPSLSCASITDTTDLLRKVTIARKAVCICKVPVLQKDNCVHKGQYSSSWPHVCFKELKDEVGFYKAPKVHVNMYIIHAALAAF